MNDEPTPMSRSHWFFSRFSPTVVLVLAAGILSGLLRAFALFLPGIAGMAAGGVLGWLTGRISKGDPEEFQTFGMRLGLSLGAGVLFNAIGAVILSILYEQPGEGPLSWLQGVINGYNGENFFGYSRNSFQSVSGQLSGGWWVIFVLIDILLFAFLFLIANGIGSSPDEEKLEDFDEAAPENWEEGLDFSPRSTGRSGPGFFLIFGAFLALSIAVFILPGRIWPDGAGPKLGLRAAPTRADIRGSWIFGPETPFLGPEENDRSFGLSDDSYQSAGHLIGEAADSGDFMFLLESKSTDKYTGSLLLHHSKVMPFLMQASEEGKKLNFVFLEISGTEVDKTLVTAHRLPVLEE